MSQAQSCRNGGLRKGPIETPAALSEGRDIEAPKFYRQQAAALATARRRRKSSIRRIHAKIAAITSCTGEQEACRSRRGVIAFANVNPSKLSKTTHYSTGRPLRRG
jgi:hypothetical protein